jgi:hypothetical protein
MKTYRILWSRSLAAALSALLPAVVPGYAQAAGEQQLFDRGWRFHLGDVRQGQSPVLAGIGWRPVACPTTGPVRSRNLIAAQSDVT